MPPPRRLIRRKPWSERVKDYLNPGDFLLWLSEEIETSDWDSKHFGYPLALFLHVVFLIAISNSAGSNSGDNDVFGDTGSRTGWLSYIATSFVYILTTFSIVNAFATFYKKRPYRLFQSAVDATPLTPSARRVRVESSPASSPLRFLTGIIGDNSVTSRIHPDPTRDVWEVAVWDPLPICLRLFCCFSPGHVMIYWLFLPTLPSDPRPSMTVFTTIFLQLLMSGQLFLLQSSFSQQEKDTTFIHKEVMNEYDTKFVHPRLNRLVRDVSTQYSGPVSEIKTNEEGDVQTYRPTVILKRGFETHPNPNYAKHFDPDNSSGVVTQRSLSPVRGNNYTPSAYNSREPTPYSGVTPRTAIRQPQFRQGTTGVASTGTSTGDGGSFGVYSHANSPLKKATSMYDMQGGSTESPRNSFNMARKEIQEDRERNRSPAKRQSDFPRLGSSSSHNRDRLLGNEDSNRRTSDPNAFGVKSRLGLYDQTPYKRGPSRF